MIKIATNFLSSLGLTVNVVNWNGDSLGNYDRENDLISLNIKKIQKLYRLNRKQLPYAKSISDYIILITCHELGHRDDKEIRGTVSDYFIELTKEYDDKFFLVNNFCDEIKEKVVTRCVESEMEAWKHGVKYISSDRLDDYNLMNKEYIDSKRRDYVKDITDLIDMKVEMLKLKIQKQVLMERKKS